MYLYSIQKIRDLIRSNFPKIKPVDHKSPIKPKEIIEHVLFMLSEIETSKDAAKASRWIGYVYRCLESSPLELFSRDEILEMCEKDVRTYNKILIELTPEELEKIMNLLEEEIR